MSDDRQWRPQLHPKARLRPDPLSNKEMLLYPEAALILNQTAAMVLHMCDGSHTVAEIVEETSLRQPAGLRAHITADISHFLKELQARGLLK